MFEDLNPLLHSQLNLSIMSLLMRVEEADFDFLKEKTATTGTLAFDKYVNAIQKYIKKN